MKKLIGTMLACVMILSLAGCGKSRSDRSLTAETDTVLTTAVENDVTGTEPAQTETTSVAEVNESDGSNILVLYFSRTGEQYTVGVIDKGNTAIVAEMIAEKTGGDLFEILPKEDYYPYTYDELTDVAKQEQNDNARPEYKDDLPDLSGYDTVFIGAPVWWGDWPMIMYTVFENNDFAGKTLIPFSTHEGSGLSGFDRKLSSACPDSTVLDGLAVRGNDAQNDQESVREAVETWVSGLGY
jgi:Flavodoxins